MIQINYELLGQGQPLILVHGWGGSINSLRKLAQLLSQEYQTIIIDLPGFGQSDQPDKDWGVGEYGKAIINLLDQLNIKTCHYFGHSFGGSLGIYLASQYPNRIAKLILCDASYQRSGQTSHTTQVIKKFTNKFSWLKKIEYPIKKIYYKIFFPNSDLLKYPQLETNFRKIMTQDLTPFLKKINCPTLILWGEKDQQTPILYAYDLNKQIKNSQLKSFPDIGHNLPLKYPEKAYNQVINFL